MHAQHNNTTQISKRLHTLPTSKHLSFEHTNPTWDGTIIYEIVVYIPIHHYFSFLLKRSFLLSHSPERKMRRKKKYCGNVFFLNSCLSRSMQKQLVSAQYVCPLFKKTCQKLFFLVEVLLCVLFLTTCYRVQHLKR